MLLPDPSLEDDYIQTFQKQVKVSIQNQQVKIEDQIMVRLFKKNSQDAYKIELSSETNMSFLYRCIITRNHYQEYLRNEAVIQTRNFTTWFRGFFDNQNFKYIFQLLNQNQAQLIISEEEKYKSYEVIRFTFNMVENKELKMNVMYRYEKMKTRRDYLDWYWKEMVAIVKTKNPSLLLQLDSKTKKNVFK